MLAHRDDILAHLAVEHFRIVEQGRQSGDEIRAFLVEKIVGWSVGKHREWGVDHDVGGHLVAACALAHRVVVDSFPVGLGGVAHGARSVVNGTLHHAEIGERDVIHRHVDRRLRPFHLLHAKHGLEVDHVGIRAVKSRGLVDAVEVEHEVMLGGAFTDAVDHLHAFLVVAVKEVDLETLDAHVGILLAGLFELGVEHVEDRPKHDANAAVFAILDEFGEIEVGNHRQHVAALRVVPTLVEHDIFDAVLRGEVDVIFICVGVDAGLEVNLTETPVVPPVPSHLSGLDPARVGHARRGCEGIYEVGGRHLRVVVGQGDYAPGEVALASFGDIVFRGGHVFLHAPGIEIKRLRIFGKHALQRAAHGVGLHEHSGI